MFATLAVKVGDLVAVRRDDGREAVAVAGEAHPLEAALGVEDDDVTAGAGRQLGGHPSPSGDQDGSA